MNTHGISSIVLYSRDYCSIHEQPWPDGNRSASRRLGYVRARGHPFAQRGQGDHPEAHPCRARARHAVRGSNRGRWTCRTRPRRQQRLASGGAWRWEACGGGGGGRCRKRLLEPPRRAWAAGSWAARAVGSAYRSVRLAGRSGGAARPRRPSARAFLAVLEALAPKKLVDNYVNSGPG